MVRISKTYLRLQGLIQATDARNICIIHKILLHSISVIVIIVCCVSFLDQYQYLGNCAPTPPLTQQ